MHLKVPFLALVLLIPSAALPQAQFHEVVRDGKRYQVPDLPLEDLRIANAHPGQCLTVSPGGLLVGVDCPTGVLYGCLLPFGDSLTQGTGASNGPGAGNVVGPSAMAYAFGLLADYGSTGPNYGTGGDQFPDMVIKVVANYTPAATNNCIVTMAAGTNDANVYGLDVSRQETTRRSLQGAIAWASVPASSKVLINSPGCVKTIGFNNADGALIYSTTAGDVLTCSIVSYNSSLDIGLVWGDTRSGSFTVSADGGPPTTISNRPPNNALIATANGVAATYVAFSIPVLRSGSHSVVITNVSGLTEPYWLGAPGFPSSGLVAPPLVFVAGQPPTRGTQTAAISLAYHQIIQQTVAAMAATGHPVVYVSLDDLTQGDYDGYTLPNGVVCAAGSIPPYHPGDCGHLKIRRDFEAAFRAAGR